MGKQDILNKLKELHARKIRYKEKQEEAWENYHANDKLKINTKEVPTISAKFQEVCV